MNKIAWCLLFGLGIVGCDFGSPTIAGSRPGGAAGGGAVEPVEGGAAADDAGVPGIPVSDGAALFPGSVGFHQVVFDQKFPVDENPREFFPKFPLPEPYICVECPRHEKLNFYYRLKDNFIPDWVSTLPLHDNDSLNFVGFASGSASYEFNIVNYLALKLAGLEQTFAEGLHLRMILIDTKYGRGGVGSNIELILAVVRELESYYKDSRRPNNLASFSVVLYS